MSDPEKPGADHKRGGAHRPGLARHMALSLKGEPLISALSFFISWVFVGIVLSSIVTRYIFEFEPWSSGELYVSLAFNAPFALYGAWRALRFIRRKPVEALIVVSPFVASILWTHYAIGVEKVGNRLYVTHYPYWSWIGTGIFFGTLAVAFVIGVWYNER